MESNTDCDFCSIPFKRTLIPHRNLTLMSLNCEFYSFKAHMFKQIQPFPRETVGFGVKL